MKTTNGKRGGNLVGKPHNDKSGNPVGGIKAQVTDAGGKPVELEGGEVIINKEASKKHWKELSRINQSAGNGVPINPPIDPHDEDPVDYEEGGKIIEFNRNHIPNKWILGYAKSIKKDHPEIWTLGGNIFGNTAFENLSRVSERGYWLDSEKWMYIKWRSYVARHAHDFRIEGVVAMLKWVDKVDKGWKYMKDLIEDKISKSKAKPKSMKDGGSVITYKMKFNKKYGFDSNESHSLAEIAKLTKLKLSALQDIYDKGIGAYKTNPQSVRPNVKSKEQWAMARVYSAVMGGKAAKVDANELERGKKYADGGSVGFENMLFTELAEHDAPSFKGGGLVDSYKRAMTNLEINGIVVYDDESETIVIAYNDGLHKRKLGIYNLNLIYKTIAIIDEDAASRIIVNINQGIFDEFDKNKVIDYNKYKTLVIINQFEVIYNSTQHDAPSFAEGGNLSSQFTPIIQYRELGITNDDGTIEYKPLPEFYLWIYDDAESQKKLDNGIYEYAYPSTDFGNDLEIIWKDFNKYKGNKRIIGFIFGSLKKTGDLVKVDGGWRFIHDGGYSGMEIGIMTTRPKFRRKGVNEFAIKYLRKKFGLEKNQVSFYEPTDMGEAFIKSGKFENGGFIPANGTLNNKNKTSKLDYKKVGNDFEFVVYDGEPNPVEGYTKVNYKKRNKNKVLMNYNQFVNYLYVEGFIDDKFKDGGEIKDEFANTKKLIDEIKKHSFYTKGAISTAKDGQKYRYDSYVLKYPNTANWLVQLFEKASEENTGKSYHTQFNHTDKYSFSYDRARFKGMPHGKMSFKELVLM